MPVANQVLAVSTFMVMFPPISYYHALVHMIAPLIILGWIAIEAERAGVRVRGCGERCCCLCRCLRRLRC